MSGTARFLLCLTRAIDLDHRRGYVAALQRESLRTRCRVLAMRLIGGVA